MLDWLATEHSDPEKELWSEEVTGGKPYYGGEILTHGINTTRGRAAEAIRDLILKDSVYVNRFRTTLARIVEDKTLSVRSCVALALGAVARHDKALALDLFDKLVATDDALLGTPYVDRFVYCALREDFPRIRPAVERMLRSKDTKLNDAGARLASLAAFHHQCAADLVDEARAGNAAHRLGIARVASANIAAPEGRVWSEKQLLLLFNDGDRNVRHEAASCFRSLQGQPFWDYESLVTAFCDSAAYKEDSFPILHALEESSQPLPGITCVVCEKFLERFAEEAKDITQGRAGDVHIVAKLLFRTYHQHQGDDWSSRCLDLIDRMCLEGIRDVKGGLEEYER